MSYNLSGIFFKEQIISAKGLRTFSGRLLSDGILQGCGISYSGASVTIAAGYLIVAGGLLHNPTAQTLSLSGASSGYARIKAVVDLSKTATKSSFKQAFFEVEYSATADGFSALTQEAVNVGGTVYEVELCVATLGSSGITSLTAPRLSTPYNHENLLCNWYLADPVNSRGLTEYTAGEATYIYAIDCWRMRSASGGTLTVGDGFVNFNSGTSDSYKRLQQFMEGLVYEVGKTYTLSMLCKVNNVGGSVTLRPMDSSNVGLKNGKAIKETGEQMLTYTFTVDGDYENAGVEILCLNTASDFIDVDIYAMKLERGSASTLAGDPPPNKEVEMVKCGMKAGIPVRLWRGTWSSGSLTVAAEGGSAGCTGLGSISDFEMVRFRFSDGQIAFAYVGSTDLSFGWSARATIVENDTNHSHITRSGDTLTIEKLVTYALSTGSGVATAEVSTAIVEIVGWTRSAGIVTS